MNEIELKWGVDGENKYIAADGITSTITVNISTNQISNAKTFFREIIYHSFLNDWDTHIVFKENQENQESDATNIIKELVELCNIEFQSIKNDTSVV